MINLQEAAGRHRIIIQGSEECSCLISDNTMEWNPLIQRYRSQMRILREYQEKITSGPDMESIHQLRLAIKRLRALLTLMERASRSEFRQEES